MLVVVHCGGYERAVYVIRDRVSPRNQQNCLKPNEESNHAENAVQDDASKSYFEFQQERS